MPTTPCPAGRSRASTPRAIACALACALLACPARADPKWSISRPVTDGKPSPLAATPLQKRAAYDKEMAAFDKLLAERNPVQLDRIDVEGIAETEGRREPPSLLEADRGPG